MARNLYTPVRDGFVQDTYVDQMGSAYVGMLAYPSDFNICDTFIASPDVDPDGLLAGIGVVEAQAIDPPRPGVNEALVDYPAAGATAADFAGVHIRNQQMGTNSAGHPCHFGGDTLNVLRRERVGGRVWVMLSNGATEWKGTAHWIVSDTTGHGHQIGSFSASAITGDTINLTFMKFLGVFTAPVGGYTPALVELTVA